MQVIHFPLTKVIGSRENGEIGKKPLDCFDAYKYVGFFSLSLWFSAAVITPELRILWNLSKWSETWLSISIPAGFVIGSFISAYYGLADKFNNRKLFAISALFSSIFNFLLVFVEDVSLGITFRLLTGIGLAGVYPTAVKMVTQWFPKQRGLATGILIAALTLGSSLPHFISVFVVSIDFRYVLLISSVLALIASLLMYGVLQDAPIDQKKTNFSIHLLKKIIKNKPVMLANYGYFGHMWELYAMWTWLPVFLAASITHNHPEIAPWLSMFISFVSIGVSGSIGCIVGGVLADKFGRSNLTIAAMSISLACAFIIGLTFGQHIWLVTIVSIIWGASAIADSGQFSVAVSEVSEVECVGTALTFQMCVGFIITIISIHIIPFLQNWLGWQWVFIVLCVGPLFGIISMIKYKRYETINTI